jgi:hypothetical protein
MTTIIWCNHCGKDSTCGVCDLQRNPICLECWNGLSKQERDKIRKRLEAWADAQILAMSASMAGAFAAGMVSGTALAGAGCSSSSGGGGTC